jgi:hypothetical protein
VVDVEQRTLRTFQQDSRTTLDRAVHAQPDVFGNRQQTRRQFRQRLHRIVHRRTLGSAAALELRIGALHARLHQHTQPVGISKVHHAHTTARHLVFVGHADAATRRADRLAGGAGLVDELVIRHHQMRALAHVQTSFTSIPSATSSSISTNKFSGSSTTPLPIAQRTPACMMPLGI